MKQPYNEIEWDEYNIYKNEKSHNVKYWEIEECFENLYVLVSKIKVKNPAGKRKALFGRTIAGRYLFIIFEDKGKGCVRPISARDMKKKERQYYDKKI